MDVVRVAECDPHRVVVGRIRNRDDALEDAKGNELRRVGRHTGDGEVDERQPMRLGQHPSALEVVELHRLVRVCTDCE